jgi:UDP-2,3-diacylglucosamine pyrophosphatase LpxH
MAKRVIFSDLHFGDPDCSLSNQPVATGLQSFLWNLGPVEDLILAGDILDANISSLTRAIEGKKGPSTWPKQIGLRHWLAQLFEGNKFDVKRIVYIPGNHDYIIWNILSTNQVFVDPISQGKVPTNLPLTEGNFPHPFIRGVAPEEVRDRFSVVYPDYEFELKGRSVLVTHGHYLDEHQTLFKNLAELIRKEKGNKKQAVRKFFIGTAQYQAVANAVSYLKGTREFVEKTYKSISSIFDAIGKLRNKPIDANMLRAIEMYLCYFRDEQPDVFIFGHTHEAGRTNTSVLGSDKAKRLILKDIDVWNDGSFLYSGSKRLAGTFVVTDDSPQTGGPIKLLQVDSEGTVAQKNV